MAKRIQPGDPKVAVGYIRVSTDEQDLGPDAQKAAIERWAQSHGVRVAAIFEDHAVSGASSIEKRPALTSALVALREHGAGLLVAAKRDRVARDTMIASMVEQAAQRAGAVLITSDGASDGAGPEGQLMRSILDSFAAYERGVIRARTRAALGVKRSRNERISGRVPFGFQLAPDGIHLEENPAERTIIGVIRTMRAAGRTLQFITQDCARLGLVSRVGRPFLLTQIARICAKAA
jgi:DNA invertase Pin-like site-specific DNA recombinase